MMVVMSIEAGFSVDSVWQQSLLNQQDV